MSDIKPRSAFAAAAHVLEHPTLERYTEGKINHDQERIDFDSLIGRQREMSGGEKVLVDCAFALWNGGWEHAPTLGCIMSQLDDDSYTRVVNAMLALRPIKTDQTEVPTS